MYEQEFMANLETPEQVREKMAQRLFDLKQRREEERLDEVNRRLEQRFKDSKHFQNHYESFTTIIIATDELRKEGSKFYTQHCQFEREQQLMEKRKKAEKDIMEE